jgi:hypothetical protein
MSILFTKKELSEEEYIVKYSLIYLGLKRIKDDAIQKIMQHDENK